MKIGSRVYVSLLSRSKIAGEAGTLIGSSARDGYKVRTDFGVIGYAQVRHVSEIVGSDAPAVGIDGSKVKVGSYVVDTDVAHMYLTQIRPLVIDPTDLLTKAVRVETPFLRVCGWVSDQWIEDGVELLNIVYDGKFAVVPRSTVTHVLKFAK
ncbi:MotB-like transcriptional regulator [Edwardsiella phage PEi20]|uniref:Modifier of transcription n=2 Tax=Kanagawavirus pei20 TaxID=2844109 RepID=A0A0B6VRC5_9CAUD|nr:MotB-like transcriptional regulator [Edwardsiella phage PEi20]BAQ22663.1 modifier of transcription [Edwardsiella phage PEi20]BAQ22964.1 modifier of transcription [Edwardsiella phage PEi26]